MAVRFVALLVLVVFTNSIAAQEVDGDEFKERLAGYQHTYERLQNAAGLVSKEERSIRPLNECDSRGISVECPKGTICQETHPLKFKCAEVKFQKKRQVDIPTGECLTDRDCRAGCKCKWTFKSFCDCSGN